MCSPYVRKEANRLHWIVKGHLIPVKESDKTVEQIYDSYFKRLWGNHEACVHEVGFEIAWKSRETEILDEREHAAVLGYN